MRSTETVRPASVTRRARRARCFTRPTATTSPSRSSTRGPRIPNRTAAIGPIKVAASKRGGVPVDPQLHASGSPQFLGHAVEEASPNVVVDGHESDDLGAVVAALHDGDRPPPRPLA